MPWRPPWALREQEASPGHLVPSKINFEPAPKLYKARW